MKTRKSISALFILGAVVLGGMKVARADIENTDKVNAIAAAKTKSQAKTLEQGIADLCQGLLTQTPSNAQTGCEEKRSQCETQIAEAFEADIQQRIDACSPSNVPDECFIRQGFNIDHCTDAGFSVQECVGQCSDNSTPTSRCLEEIDLSRRLAIETAKYKAQLLQVCRAEEAVNPPTDPVVNDAQEQNPNQGVENPAGNAANGGQNASGGCSMTGVGGSTGSLFPFILGSLPILVARNKKRK